MSADGSTHALWVVAASSPAATGPLRSSLCRRFSSSAHASPRSPSPCKINESKPRDDEYTDKPRRKKADGCDKKRRCVERRHTMPDRRRRIRRAHFLVISYPLGSYVPDQTWNKQRQYKPARPVENSAKYSRGGATSHMLVQLAYQNSWQLIIETMYGG
jgi:hypothetical protein